MYHIIDLHALLPQLKAQGMPASDPPVGRRLSPATWPCIRGVCAGQGLTAGLARVVAFNTRHEDEPLQLADALGLYLAAAVVALALQYHMTVGLLAATDAGPPQALARRGTCGTRGGLGSGGRGLSARAHSHQKICGTIAATLHSCNAQRPQP